MSLLNKMKYSFISKAMDKETFTVVSFKGFEAVSKPYEFEILLVSEKRDIDPLLVLQNPAIFTIHRDEEDNVDFNGILIQFEESQEFNDYLFFKAVLAPKLFWLSLTHHNQVFLDLTIPEIMEDALKDGGLKQTYDFDFNLNPNNIYKKLEYICQYDESHFNFVSRWAEREGLYYFFEQTPKGEKVVFTDTKMEHKDLLLGKDLIYDPQSGLASLHTKEVIQSFICKHNLLPQRVYLKDYNYLKPSQAMEGIADVDENGRGENYIYGVHFDSVNEGNRLAKIRAEALLCRKSIFQGESSVPFMVPGYTFDLNEHYKDVYNRKYLVTDVTHEGHQTGYLISGISGAVEHRDEEMFYSNTFTAIYANEQFRPEHLSKKPRISGTLNAKIDASGEGVHPELDDHGRYKIILPFDRSGRFGGKASAFVRMMQPSAGQNQGMHFPLHKGTEVLLTFIDGNPDRPIIAGAVPNPETPSMVNSSNQALSTITTGRNPNNMSAGAGDARARGNSNPNNYIEFNDTDGSESITIHSPNKIETFAGGKYKRRELGPSEESGHDRYEADDDDDDGFLGKIDTPSANSKADDLLEIMQNFSPSNVYGYDEKTTLPEDDQPAPNNLEEFIVAPVPAIPDTFTDFFKNTPKIWCFTDGTADDYDYYELPDLYESVGEAWEDYWNYWVKQNHPDAKGYQNIEYINHTPSRPINHPWYVSGWDVSDNDTSKRLRDYLRQSVWDSHCDTKWKAWIEKTKEDWKKWMPHYARGHVRVSHRDTFHMQEGNYYDFGGYWVYNLGNAYIENHMDQSGVLNTDNINEDLLNKGGPYWNNVDWSKAYGYGQTCTNPDEDPPTWSFNTDRKLGKADLEIGTDVDWKEATADANDTSVWVEKSFGNSYSYKDGNSIEVTKGDTLNIQHSSKEIDIVFRKGGAIKSWEKKEKGTLKAKKTWDSKGRTTSEMTYGDGILNETTWNYFAKGENDGNLPKLSQKYEDKNAGIISVHTHCRDTGNIIAFSSKHQGFNSTHNFNFNWANTAKASFTFAAGTSFSFKAATNLDLAVSAALDLSIAAYVAGKINLSAYAAAKLDLSVYAGINLSASLSASLDVKLNLGTGVAIELDARNFGKIVYCAADGTAEVKVGGATVLKKGATLDVCIDTLKLEM